MSLRMPLLPECFLHWTEPATDHSEDALRLVTWRRSLTLKGSSFRLFEDRVFPLLTGKHSVAEICSQVEDVFQKDDVIAALDMLAVQGILVEGDGAPEYRADIAAQLGWLNETAPNGRDAQKNVSEAHIVVFGAGAQGAVTARAIAAAGIGRLTIVDPATVQKTDPYFSGLFKPEDVGHNRADILANRLVDDGGLPHVLGHAMRPEDVASVKPLIRNATLVLCCLDLGELNLILLLNIACRELGISWLAASLEGTDIVVGPGFSAAGDGPCYMCWRFREIASAANPQTRLSLEKHLNFVQADLSTRRESLASAADIAGGMLATEALTWLTGANASNLDGRFLSIDMLGLRMEKHTILRKPDCPVCGVTAAAK